MRKNITQKDKGQELSTIPKVVFNPGNNQSKMPDRKKATTTDDWLKPPSLRLIVEGIFVSKETMFEAVAILSTRRILEQAKKTSMLAQLDIYNWENKINQLLIKRTGKKSFQTSNTDNSDEYYESSLELKLKYLSINDWIVIANYNLPTHDFANEIYNRTKKLIIPTLSISYNVKTGCKLSYFLLLLSIIYFFLYSIEAQKLSSYPSNGTLFHVFRNSIVAKIIFIIMALIPVISSSMLTYTHFRKSIFFNIMTFIIIIFSLLSIYFIQFKKNSLKKEDRFPKTISSNEYFK